MTAHATRARLRSGSVDRVDELRCEVDRDPHWPRRPGVESAQRAFGERARIGRVRAPVAHQRPCSSAVDSGRLYQKRIKRRLRIAGGHSSTSSIVST